MGFEPTPLRNGALSHRLRPLGQTVMFSLREVKMKHRGNLGRKRKPPSRQVASPLDFFFEGGLCLRGLGPEAAPALRNFF